MTGDREQCRNDCGASVCMCKRSMASRLVSSRLFSSGLVSFRFVSNKMVRVVVVVVVMTGVRRWTDGRASLACSLCRSVGRSLTLSFGRTHARSLAREDEVKVMEKERV